MSESRSPSPFKEEGDPEDTEAELLARLAEVRARIRAARAARAAAVPPAAVPHQQQAAAPAAPPAGKKRAGKAPGRPNQRAAAGANPIHSRMGVLRIDVPRYANGQPVKSAAWVFIYRGGIDPPGDPNHPELGNGAPAPFSGICMQGEVGPQNQGFHWQGYIEFDDRYTALEVRRMMEDFGWDANRLYLRPRWGTQQQAIDYCRKIESRADQELYPDTLFREAGSWHQPSAAAAPGAVEDAIKEGMSEKEIMQRFPDYYLRHSSGIARMCQKLTPRERWRKVEVHVLYGKTRTGKTRTAIDCSMDDTMDEKNPDGKLPYIKRLTKDGATQWDLYDGEEYVIIDEHIWQRYPLFDLLADTDGTFLSRNMKYGTAHARWKYVFITSNIDPNTWYKDASPEHYEAWLARCPRSHWHNIDSPEAARRFREWWPTRHRSLRTASEVLSGHNVLYLEGDLDNADAVVVTAEH